MTTHALTIDLEDWHQLVRRRVTGELRAASDHVIRSTHLLLDMLDECNVKATFFTVGMLAEVHPGLVREVAARGHEIGSHSFAHQLIYTLQREEFLADVARSRKQLQDLTGQPVLGFRAPEFSVGHLRHWSFGALAEAGFGYDSSVFPVTGARYGIPDAPRTPFRIETEAGALWEFPLATWKRPKAALPIAGGTYFRILPSALLKKGVDRLEQAGEQAVLYFHPYEFHDRFLSLDGLTMKQRMSPSYMRMLVLHNLFTPSIVSRLRRLLTQFSFSTLGALYRATAQNH